MVVRLMSIVRFIPMRIHLLLLIGWTEGSYAKESSGLEIASAIHSQQLEARRPLEKLASLLLVLPNSAGILGRREAGSRYHQIVRIPKKQFSTSGSAVRSSRGLTMLEDEFVVPAKEVSAPEAPSSSKIPLPPRDLGEMMSQATAAVKRALDDGKTRVIVRLLIPRGDGLAADDESWEGGIMQLYGRVSPMVRDLVGRVGGDIGGVRPKMTEQRLDASGVDGESVWMMEGATAKDDILALVQPSQERAADIRKFSDQAGERAMLLVNPQWKDRDDPLDFVSRKGGVVGAIGNFLGGKAGLLEKLDELGFLDVYRLDEFSCRGSRIVLFLAYPNGWNAFYFNNGKGTFVPILTNSPTRPTYQETEQALIDNGVPFKMSEFQDVI